jgi:hypothetical protein
MKKHIVSMQLNVISYKDDEAHYSYCPALNLIGCGHTKVEASKSFNIVLEEYIRYTTENNTLIKDLQEHGWKIEGNKMTPPKITEMLQSNDDLDDVFNKYDFNKYSIPIQMPIA